MICLSVYITKNQFIEQDCIQGQNAMNCFKTLKLTKWEGHTVWKHIYPQIGGKRDTAKCFHRDTSCHFSSLSTLLWNIQYKKSPSACSTGLIWSVCSTSDTQIRSKFKDQILVSLIISLMSKSRFVVNDYQFFFHLGYMIFNLNTFFQLCFSPQRVIMRE